MPRYRSRVRASFPAPNLLGKLIGFPIIFCITGFCPYGAIANRLCPGLQIRLAQFDSGSRLQINQLLSENIQVIIFLMGHWRDIANEYPFLFFPKVSVTKLTGISNFSTFSSAIVPLLSCSKYQSFYLFDKHQKYISSLRIMYPVFCFVVIRLCVCLHLFLFTGRS